MSKLKLTRKCPVCGKKIIGVSLRYVYCEEHRIKNRANLLYSIVSQKSKILFRCTYPGCKQRATSLINQKPYCKEHYYATKLDLKQSSRPMRIVEQLKKIQDRKV